MLNQGLVGFLGRNRQDTAALFQKGGDPIFDKTHEGLDGGEPHIAGTRAIAPPSFEMSQEIHHQRSIDLFQRKRRWRHTQALTGKLKEQDETTGIAITSMHAGAALQRETLT